MHRKKLKADLFYLCFTLTAENENSYILTYFWVDNFNLKVETQGGGGAINSTLVAFQETAPSVALTSKVDIPRSRRRSLEIEKQGNNIVVVNLKRERNNRISSITTNYDVTAFRFMYNLWSLYRYLNKIDQNVPIFSAWRAQINNI